MTIVTIIVIALSTIQLNQMQVNPQTVDSVTTIQQTKQLPIHKSTIKQKEVSTIKQKGVSTIKQKELLCLAHNIYFEGRGESLVGQLAIGMVTINRVNHKSFPNTICKVVWQRGRNKKKALVAQFSWTLDKNSNTPKAGIVWDAVLQLAKTMTKNGDLGTTLDPTNGALYYHSTQIDPNWTNLTKVTRIENHQFYK